MESLNSFAKSIIPETNSLIRVKISGVKKPSVFEALVLFRIPKFDIDSQIEH